MSSILKMFSYVSLVCVTTSTEVSPLSPDTLSRFRGYVWNGIDYSGLHAVSDARGNHISTTAHFVVNQFYFVYGIYHNINLWLGFDLLFTQTPGVDNNFGLGDGRIGGKFSLLKQSNIPFGLAFETSIKVPLADYDTGKINSFGTGQTDLDLGLIFGHKVVNFPLSLALESGYRLRFRDPPDQLYIVFEINMQYFSPWNIKLKSYFNYSFSGLEYRGDEFNQLTEENNGKFPFPALKTRYVVIALELEYQITSRFSLGGKGSYTIYARNSGILYTVGVSLGYLI